MVKKLIKYLVKSVLLALIISALFFAAVFYGFFGHLYTKSELMDFKNETASLVLSDNGSLIGKFFADNRTNIEYNQIPSYLINALIATEDNRYFEHEGVDSRSLLRVLIKTILLQQKSSGGGSTITQQLAKNMYGRKNFGAISMPVSKLKEAILAYRLENIYNKEEILTLYLNTVPFGENVLGIESAARRYFNKSVYKLKIEEAAVLVGMLKANTYYNPRLYPEHAVNRRNVVLEQMNKYSYLSDDVTDSIQKLTLKLDYANLESEGTANYFLVQVKSEVKDILNYINKNSDTKYDIRKSGLIIETTLNVNLQNYALQAFKSHLSKMQNRLNNQYKSGSSKVALQKLVDSELKKLKLAKNAYVKKNREMFSWDGFYTDSISVRDSLKQVLTLLHAGFIAVDPNTGAIKSWVGGIDYRTQPYDQIFAQRQTASAFKPILYVTALEDGAMPCQYLDNDALILSDFDNWQPRNYDHSIGGKYSMSASLSKSMNIPTVNLFLQIPFSNLEYTWNNLGFTQELIHRPSTALGTATASLYEMIFAYASFANGGIKVEPKIIVSVKTSKGKIVYQNKKLKSPQRVLEKQSTDLLNAMLQKAMVEGTGRSMKNKYGVNLSLAGKTGTSQDYADAWFLAYNPNLVVATRVGASLPIVHFNNGANGSGSTLALPLIARTLQKVQNNKSLRKRYFTSFAELPFEYEEALNCNDFVDSSEIEKLFDRFFKNKSTTFDKASKKASRKAKRKQRKSLFKRIFEKKDD
jgi:penicillin-binding protein 1A